MLYKFEAQTNKEGTTAIAPTAQYEDDLAAEVAFHQSVAYNLQQGESLSSFLVMIITETGYVNPNLTKFYNFETLEPNPEN